MPKREAVQLHCNVASSARTLGHLVCCRYVVDVCSLSGWVVEASRRMMLMSVQSK